ncbi:MAG: undecaprenyl-phosphate glucose phosphotransferase [Oscillospiraceae bacterium]|nr:undecaprenyl-phosphate glucose phosphotransferase [Oscillospiraceae bacterium]
MIKENQKLLNRLNVLSDAVVSVIAVIASYLIVFFLLDFEENYPLIDYIKLALVYIPIQFITYSTAGLYDSHRAVRFTRELKKIFQAFLIDGLIIVAMLYVVKIINFSRFALALFLVLDLVLITTKRFILRQTLKHFRKSGYNKKYVVIIGGGETAETYLNTIIEESHMGFECAGYISDTGTLDAKKLGGYKDIFDVLDKTSYSEVVCALDSDEMEHLGTAVEACELTGTKISVIPAIYKYMSANPSIDVVGGIPMLNIRRIPLDNKANAFLKRAMDIVGSLFLLIVTSPVMLVAAIVIKATMGGKVIFKQQRVGLNKKIFTMYKLKSMRDNDQSDTAWSTDNDPRKTRFGAFIRKFSIDEFPQFFNVLKGDMSLVGPRPEIPHFVENFKQSIPMYMIKHQVKPGITGLAQIKGYRGDTSIEKRIKYDIRYIENWDIFLDISILVKTVLSGFINKEKLKTTEKKTHKPEKHFMNKEKQKIDYMALAIFFPAVLALGIIPILAQATLVAYESVKTYNIFGAALSKDNVFYLMDIYSQCKAFAVVLFALIMLAVAAVCCVFLFRRIDKKMWVYTGASALYVIMALASALCSQFQEVAFYGIHDRAEGFYTTACYFVLFLFTMFAFRKTQNFRYVVIALMVCTGVNFIHGMFQYTGNSVFHIDFLKSFFIDSQYKDVIDINQAGIAPQSMYGTLYHYNYVGSFTGMIIPLFTVLAIGEKGIWKRILFVLFDLISVFMLFASSARSGVVAVAVVVVVGVVVFARVLIRHWKISVSVVAAGVVLLVGANFALDNKLFSRIPSLVSDALELVLPAEDTTDMYSTLPVREILHNKDGSVTFVTQSDELNVKFSAEDGCYNFTDGDGNIIESLSTGAAELDAEKHKGLHLEITSEDNNPDYGNVMKMWFDGNKKASHSLNFVLFNDKQLHLVYKDSNNKVKPINAEAIGFEGKEKLGSSRGYIWSRTIPLLDECLLIGYGPDTFPYVFPQNDYLAKYYAYGEGFHITVDKPHNLYLQIFISNGLVALIAFLAICGLYVVDCFRLYALKKQYRIEQIYGISVMLAIIGYLVAGFFNDSVVSVAPVFWILLGTGAALNTINHRMDRNELFDVDEIVEDKPAESAVTDTEMQAYEDRAKALAQQFAEEKQAKEEAQERLKAEIEAQLNAEMEARERNKDRVITKEERDALLARVNRIVEARQSAGGTDSADENK